MTTVKKFYDLEATGNLGDNSDIDDSICPDCGAPNKPTGTHCGHYHPQPKEHKSDIEQYIDDMEVFAKQIEENAKLYYPKKIPKKFRLVEVKEGTPDLYVITLINSYWRFDSNQRPMSSWHEKQDLIEKLKTQSLTSNGDGVEAIEFGKFILEKGTWDNGFPQPVEKLYNIFKTQKQ